MPKVEINLVKGNSYVCSGRLSIGIILNPLDNSVILIDSGLENDTAKSVNAAIIAKKWSVAAIINTHSHADHCGGNAYFQLHYPGITICATPIEQFFIENPSMEPWYLSSGAAPMAELKNKFLQAAPSKVTSIIPYIDNQLIINSVNLSVITLPGHTPGMIGIVNLTDRVLYAGDSVFSAETLNKHGIPFYTNIMDTRDSLRKLFEIRDKYDYCVLYHGGIETVTNMQSLIDLHMQKLQYVEEFIFGVICEKEQSFDLLTSGVMRHFNISNDICQFYLTETCVKSYVAGLQKQGKLKLIIEAGNLFISKTEKLTLTGSDHSQSLLFCKQLQGQGVSTKKLDKEMQAEGKEEQVEIKSETQPHTPKTPAK